MTDLRPRLLGTLGWVLLVSALIAVPYLRLVLPLETSELEDAADIGLVSFTVLADYPDSQELPVFLWYVLIAPAIVGILLVWRRRGGAGEPPPHESRPEARPRWAVVAAVALLTVLALDVGYLLASVPWGRFGFLAEEGVYLGTAAGLRAGSALYRDLAFSYGPLMGWPIPLALRLAGDDVIGYRLLVWAGNTAGLALGWAVLSSLVRRPLVVLGGLLLLGILAVPVLPNLNATTLRLALGAAAVVWAGLGAGTNRAPLQLLGGATAGIALGFSFEVGVAALLAGAAASLLPWTSSRRQALNATARFGIGALATLLPVVLLLAIRGELAAAVATFARMISLPGAGYQALPWPDLLGWFRDAAGQHRPFPASALTYAHPEEAGFTAERFALSWWGGWPWLVLGAGSALAVFEIGARLRRGSASGPIDGRTCGLIGLAAFCVVMGRGAVGRSDLYHLQFYGTWPMAVVGAALVDRLVDVRGSRRTRARVLAGLLIGGALISTATWPPRYHAPGADRGLASRMGVLDADLVVVDRPRCRHLRLQPSTVREVHAVVDWAAALPETRSVWFYPSEAAYYWLTDRRPATPYPWAYDAATRQQRLDLVARLEREPPDCVLVTEQTFSIDHIPGRQLLPEIDRWLSENYVTDDASLDLPGATVLRHDCLEPGACGG